MAFASSVDIGSSNWVAGGVLHIDVVINVAAVVYLMNQNFENIFKKVNLAQMLFWLWDALSAEISVLQNVLLHANVSPKLIEKYHVYAMQCSQT